MILNFISIIVAIILFFFIVDKYFPLKKTEIFQITEKHIEKSVVSIFSNSAGTAHSQEIQRCFVTIAINKNINVIELSLNEYNQALVGKGIKIVKYYGHYTKKLYKTCYDF